MWAETVTASALVHEFHTIRLQNLSMTTAPGDNVTVETRMAVLETQIDTLQEGQQQILARLDSMERSNDARFESMQQRFDTMQRSSDARFDAMQQRLDTIQQRSEARMDSMQQSITSQFDSMQQRSDARYDAAQQRSDARDDAINSRIDRLFYTILGLGIAAIGALIALDRFF